MAVFRWIVFVCLMTLANSAVTAQSYDDSPLFAGQSQTVDGLPEVMMNSDAFPRTPAVSVEIPIRRFKPQFLQSVELKGGAMVSTSGNDLDARFAELSVGLGIPLFSLDNILVVTPAFRMDFIDAAPQLDIPAELYEAGAGFFFRRPLRPGLSAMTIVRPTVRSDFTTSDNALRLFGLALLNWECVPGELTLSGGAVSLGRADLPVLPAAGLTWTPRPTSRLELRFPESRVAWRLARDGDVSETWLYGTAGLGGNTWAVTRRDGRPDELSLRDLRLMLGVEHLVQGGGGWFAECGLALDRRIEYESTQSEVPLSEAVLLQAGWRY